MHFSLQGEWPLLYMRYGMFTKSVVSRRQKNAESCGDGDDTNNFKDLYATVMTVKGV